MNLKTKYIGFKVNLRLFLKLLPASLTLGLFYIFSITSLFIPFIIFQDIQHTLLPFLNYFLGKIFFLLALGLIWVFLIKFYKIISAKYWDKYFHFQRKVEIMEYDKALHNNVKYLDDGTPYIIRKEEDSTAKKIFGFQIFSIWLGLTILFMEVIQKMDSQTILDFL